MTRASPRRSRSEAARRRVGPVGTPSCAVGLPHWMWAPVPRCTSVSVRAMQLMRAPARVLTVHRPSCRAVLSVPRTSCPVFVGFLPRTASPALSPCGGVSRWESTMRRSFFRRGNPDAFLLTTSRRPRPVVEISSGRPDVDAEAFSLVAAQSASTQWAFGCRALLRHAAVSATPWSGASSTRASPPTPWSACTAASAWPAMCAPRSSPVTPPPTSTCPRNTGAWAGGLLSASPAGPKISDPIPGR